MSRRRFGKQRKNQNNQNEQVERIRRINRIHSYIGCKKSVIPHRQPVRIALFLLLTLSLSLLSTPLLPTPAAESATDPTATENGTPDAAEVLLEGLIACAEEIDLSACALPVAELNGLFSRVMNNTPELFHVAPRLSYTYNAAYAVVSVFPVYTLTGDELTAARRLYLDTLTAFCTDLDTARRTRPGHVRWSEADTVLFLHDWMVTRFEYDTSGKNFDAYRLFRDGVGVCQAYSLAFLALARAAGLSADTVVSAAMDHAWNHVMIDGVCYHIDVTRDDPIHPAETPGSTEHSRFLLSDAALTALGYHGFSCSGEHSCTDTRFQQADGRSILADIHTPLLCLPLGWYITDADTLPAPVRLPAGAERTEQLSEKTHPPASDLTATIGQGGDLDRDGSLTVADLLLLCALADRPEIPETAPDALRKKLLSQAGG